MHEQQKIINTGLKGSQNPVLGRNGCSLAHNCLLPVYCPNFSETCCCHQILNEQYISPKNNEIIQFYLTNKCNSTYLWYDFDCVALGGRPAVADEVVDEVVALAPWRANAKRCWGWGWGDSCRASEAAPCTSYCARDTKSTVLKYSLPVGNTAMLEASVRNTVDGDT